MPSDIIDLWTPALRLRLGHDLPTSAVKLSNLARDVAKLARALKVESELTTARLHHEMERTSVRARLATFAAASGYPAPVWRSLPDADMTADLTANIRMTGISRDGIALSVPGMYRGEPVWVMRDLYRRGRVPGRVDRGELDVSAMLVAWRGYCATCREASPAEETP